MHHELSCLMDGIINLVSYLALLTHASQGLQTIECQFPFLALLTHASQGQFPFLPNSKS